MKKEADNQAFTLVELLVVIAIIALLIALFMPNMTGMLQGARTFQCASNLKHIGEAVANHRAVGAGEFAVGGWPSIVLPLLDGQGGILICPDVDPNEEVIAANYTPLETMGQMVFGNGNVSPLAEHPWVAKLSGTQHAAARADGKLSGAESANYWSPPAYVPDANPHIFWLCYEDLHGGDADFKDTMLKITQVGGVSEITFWRGGGTGVSSSLEDFESGIVRSLGTWGGGNDLAEQTDIDPYPFATGGETTYGMNINVVRLDGGTNKILVVDFDEVVVDTDAGAWEDDPSTGLPTFARHGGKMNALRMDGSVKLESPDDIDPATPTVGDRGWR